MSEDAVDPSQNADPEVDKVIKDSCATNSADNSTNFQPQEDEITHKVDLAADEVIDDEAHNSANIVEEDINHEANSGLVIRDVKDTTDNREDEVQVVKEVADNVGVAEDKVDSGNSEPPAPSNPTTETAVTHSSDGQNEKLEDAFSTLKINDADDDSIQAKETDSEDTVAFQNRVNELLSYFTNLKAEEDEEKETPEFGIDETTQTFNSKYRIPFEKEQAESVADPEFTDEKVIALLTENSANMTPEQLKLLEQFRVCCLRRKYRKDYVASKVLNKMREIEAEKEEKIREVNKKFLNRMQKIDGQYWEIANRLTDKANGMLSDDDSDD